ncbi:hypothetical protein ACIPY3_03085 [Paenarthrobacter sp. NPDC089714]
MEVTLTIKNEEGDIGHVTATGADYDAAHAAALALIPEDCKSIVIRTAE